MSGSSSESDYSTTSSSDYDSTTSSGGSSADSASSFDKTSSSSDLVSPIESRIASAVQSDAGSPVRSEVASPVISGPSSPKIVAEDESLKTDFGAGSSLKSKADDPKIKTRSISKVRIEEAAVIEGDEADSDSGSSVLSPVLSRSASAVGKDLKSDMKRGRDEEESSPSEYDSDESDEETGGNKIIRTESVVRLEEMLMKKMENFIPLTLAEPSNVTEKGVGDIKKPIARSLRSSEVLNIRDIDKSSESSYDGDEEPSKDENKATRVSFRPDVKEEVEQQEEEHVSTENSSSEVEISDSEIDERGLVKPEALLSQCAGKMQTNAKMDESYHAAMTLAAVGDGMGYHCGRFEFNRDGRDIHEQVEKLGGVKKLILDDHEWMVSDDTVLHNAIAKALISKRKNGKRKYKTMSELLNEIMRVMIKEFNEDMAGRAPGFSCGRGVQVMDNSGRWDMLEYAGFCGGCGAAIRSMCIGLAFPAASQFDLLLAVSIENGRMTHNHPTGFFGAYASAIFASFAVRRIPVKYWGRILLDSLPSCYEYLRRTARDWENYQKDLFYFEERWQEYLKLRNIYKPHRRTPKFPDNFDDVQEREDFIRSVSFSGWGGSSGHDAPMIAYDALLYSGDDWIKFCKYGILHGGDSDSTGCIGACLFGACFGFKNVPRNHYKDVEYSSLCRKLGAELLSLSEENVSLKWE